MKFELNASDISFESLLGLLLLGKHKRLILGFIFRDDFNPESQFSNFLQIVASNLIEKKQVSRWPGTILHEGAHAVLWTVNISDSVIQVFRDQCLGLNNFQHPYLPEDIHIFQDDSNALLASVTADDWCSINIDMDDLAWLRINQANLANILDRSAQLNLPGEK